MGSVQAILIIWMDSQVVFSGADNDNDVEFLSTGVCCEVRLADFVKRLLDARGNPVVCR